MAPIRLVASEPGQSRYAALAAALRQRIVAAEWPPGSALPAELSLAAGIESLHVPYRAGLVSTALLGNEVDFTFDTLAALPQVRNGRLRALGVTSGTRWRELPDVPTLEEAGYPMLRYDLWTGVMAPRARRPRSSTRCIARSRPPRARPRPWRD